MKHAWFFRWRVKAGHEDAFVRDWEEMTRLLLPDGSGGSALYRAPDGTYLALARWPDPETRARSGGPDAEALRERMQIHIAETLLATPADSVSDLWTSMA